MPPAPTAPTPGVRRGLEVPGGGDGRGLCTKSLLCSVLLCVCVWQVFWGPICNGILGPKEYPLRMSFGQNSSFFGTTRESRCCYRNSFERWLKSSREFQVLHYCLLFKSTALLSGPLVCPAHRVTKPPALPGRVLSHCAIHARLQLPTLPG